MHGKHTMCDSLSVGAFLLSHSYTSKFVIYYFEYLVVPEGSRETLGFSVLVSLSHKTMVVWYNHVLKRAT